MLSLRGGGRIVRSVKEVGSGLNDERRLLVSLLETTNDWDILLVEHKDRLTRFGFNYIETLLSEIGCKIEVVNGVKNDEEDLVQDLVSIITSFTARIYGRRRSQRKTEKLIEEMKREDAE